MSGTRQHRNRDTQGLYQTVHDRKYGPEEAAESDAKFIAAMKGAHPELNVGVKQADPNETVMLVRFRPSATISLLGSSAGDCADLGSKGG